MSTNYKITIDGKTFQGRSGEILLDAALKNGVSLPYDCRSGHCGTCCVKLTDGEVQGGAASEKGVVHACQCRIIGDASIETRDQPSMKTVRGIVRTIRDVSAEVVEVEIQTQQAMPYLAGQYAQLRFAGYPSRPYSLTHPLSGTHDGRSLWFHIRRQKGGRVSPELGSRILPGHKLTVTGPYGSAYFRPNLKNRMILISTGTGFSPIWSIVASALHENPQRMIMLIVGGSNMEALYMGPALGRLSRFPNVRILPVCSAPQMPFKAIRPGRPTDYMPRLYPSDVIYTCGVPAMVEDIRKIAARAGAVCYADPFVPSADKEEEKESTLSKALSWLPLPNAANARRQPARVALMPPRSSAGKDRYPPVRAAG